MSLFAIRIRRIASWKGMTAAIASAQSPPSTFFNRRMARACSCETRDSLTPI
jgi:hypothetical protein